MSGAYGPERVNIGTCPQCGQPTIPGEVASLPNQPTTVHAATGSVACVLGAAAQPTDGRDAGQ